jgi:hypothetical protein
MTATMISCLTRRRRLLREPGLLAFVGRFAPREDGRDGGGPAGSRAGSAGRGDGTEGANGTSGAVAGRGAGGYAAEAEAEAEAAVAGGICAVGATSDHAGIAGYSGIAGNSCVDPLREPLIASGAMPILGGVERSNARSVPVHPMHE